MAVYQRSTRKRKSSSGESLGSRSPGHPRRDERHVDKERRDDEITESGRPPEEERDVDEDLDFSQYQGITQPDDEEDVSSESPKMTDRIAKLDEKTRESLTNRLVRYLVYKGITKMPIKFGDINKDVFPNHANVSRYFFNVAKKHLRDVFGFKIVGVDDTLFDGKFSAGKVETYFVLNALHNENHLYAINAGYLAPHRGLLMLICGLIWCSPERRLHDRLMFRSLHQIDQRISADMNSTAKHPLFQDNVASIIKQFEKQLYLISEKSDEVDDDGQPKIVFIYGPRTLLEIGKRSILFFVHKLIMKRPPDEHLLTELLHVET